MYIENTSPTFLLRHQSNCSNCNALLNMGLSLHRFVKTNKIEEELITYNTFKGAAILIVCNRGTKLSSSDCLDILYALTLNKAIILLDAPIFEDNILPFMKELISKKLSKILIMDITILDEYDLMSFMKEINTAPTNFTLTRHEKVITRFFLNSYFRRLEA